MSIVKTLLALQIYEVTGNEIGEHFKRDKRNLPTYSLNPKNGKIIESEYWLQFIEEGEEKYIVFEYYTCDALLQEEINGAGLEELLKNTDLRPFFEEFRKLNMFGSREDYFYSIRTSSYIVIDLEYYGGGSWYEDDYEVYYNCKGILDRNFNFIEINQ